MKRLLLYCLLACFLHSCSFFEDELLKMKIKHSTQIMMKRAGENSLEIDFRELTGIDYDSLYFFQEYCSSYIEPTLGIPYKTWHEIPDSYKRLIFLKDNRIVNIVDIYSSDIDFCIDYTERKTNNDSYIAHYGSKYIVKKIIGGYNQTTYIYIKEKENGIPLYFRRQAEDGRYIFSEIQ